VEAERLVEASGLQGGPQPLVQDPPAERLAGNRMTEYEAVGIRLDDVGVAGARQALELAGDDVGYRDRAL
jgi:hypothetical protein